MSREAHVESIAIAKQGIEDFATILAAVTEHRSNLLSAAFIATEKQNDAIALTSLAVGDEPGTESARNALEFTLILGERLEEFKGIIGGVVDERIKEMARIADNIGQELDRYMNGF